jgi:lysyl-tRNA synthetase class 2
MSEIHGRVVESWPSGETQSIAIVVADRQTIVALRPGEPRLDPGDIVSLSSSADGARVLAVHARPGAEWDPSGDALRWRQPARSPTRMELLWRRQTVVRAIRDHFFSEGFLEIQAPLYVRGTCPDAHIASMMAGSGYLTTSTEYQIKRLEVGGFDKVFTLTQNFRAADVGDRHNPEFTMLEWARTFATLDDIERDVESFVKRAFRALHPDRDLLVYRGREIRIEGPWERLTVSEAFERHLGIRLRPDAPEALREDVQRKGIDVPPSFLDDPHLLFSYLIDSIQTHLGAPAPTFLREWPAFMTSSAALREGAPAFTERSELMIAGLELSDGFPSLRDAALQRRLFQRELDRRAQEGLPAVEIDERYLAALGQGIPPGAGMALGVDRLVMILTGAERIRDVIPFAWDEL